MKYKYMKLVLCITVMSYYLSISVMAQENNLIHQDAVEDQEVQSQENKEVLEDRVFEKSAYLTVDFSEKVEIMQDSELDTVQNTQNNNATSCFGTSSNEIIQDSNVNEGKDTRNSIQSVQDVIDGWKQDEYGYYHYYQNGSELKGTIAEIETSSEEVHAYYFDNNGRLFDDILTNCYVSLLNQTSGYVATDEYGYLIKGWGFEHQYYYGEDYFRYENQILEEDGELYYFGNDGKLYINTSVVVDGTVYIADANGRLIPNDMSEKTEWVKANECWYLYVNGELVKEQLYTQGENTYYLDKDGKMQIGMFYYYDGEKGYQYLVADQNGVIQYENNWYLIDGDWYYVNENGYAVYDKFYTINNQKYYFDYNGKMKTGLFELFSESNGEWERKLYLADSSGIVQSNSGWCGLNNTWYYINEDGTLARECFILDNNYYINYWGEMETGLFDASYRQEYSTYYYAREDGLILKNQWVKDGLFYYYTGKDGSLLTEQWIEDTYYLDKYGAMVIGSYEIDGTVYKFDNDGRKIGTLEKNGWQFTDGKWYYYTSEENIVNGWFYYGNAWYYLENSEMITNREISGSNEQISYCVGCDGKMIENQWKYWNYYGLWSYANADGSLVKNAWKKINNNWYYFTDTIMLHDTLKVIDGIPYLFDKNGVWIDAIKNSGWLQTDSGDWYYINEDGRLNTKEKKMINGSIYYFNTNGILKKNTIINNDNEYYWIDENGTMDKTDGWKTDGYNWVYFFNGKLQTGLITIQGNQYYLSPQMLVGLYYVNDEYMFFDSNGVRQPLKEGWMSVEEYGSVQWYYIKNGNPVTGWVDGYYFQSNGILLNGKYTNRNAHDRQYFFDENGYLKKNGWIKDGEFWYYADSIGILYTGERVIDGITYFFDITGRWIK